MPVIIALLSGILFGAGLAVSGMADPARVRAFLDIFGDWDPTLAFVMGGATIVMALAWMAQRRMARPAAADRFNLPDTRLIDAKLAIGAIVFGIGWGLGGLCPGPAIASIALSPAAAGPFVLAMIAGMGLHRITTK